MSKPKKSTAPDITEHVYGQYAPFIEKCLFELGGELLAPLFAQLDKWGLPYEERVALFNSCRSIVDQHCQKARTPISYETMQREAQLWLDRKKTSGGEALASPPVPPNSQPEASR